MPAAEGVNANIYDALPIGVCVIDSQLRVHAWNSCLITWTGVAWHEIEGRRLSQFYPEIERGTVHSRLKTVFEGSGQPIVLSASLHQRFLPVRTREGGWMRQRTHVRRLAGCQEPLALVAIEDLTQPFAQLESLRNERWRLGESEASLKKRSAELEEANVAIADARDKAEHANHSKSAFLANMSHEIRTPLTAILGYADILIDAPDPALLHDAAVTIRRNGDHLLAIVNDILDLSKIEAGRMQIDLAPCDPLGVAEEVVSLLRVRAESKRIGLELSASPLPSAIESDSIRLRQVLLNLIGNAIKFSQHGSVRLDIDWDQSRHQLRFDIIDTGIGVAADDLEAIFQPFNQADTSAKRRFGGTGLGLTICRRLAEMLGGQVIPSSELGKGSTFSLILPAKLVEATPAVSTDQASPSVATPTGSTDRPPLAGLDILVAEDGLDNQRLVRYLLEKAGAQITIVGDGKRAVQRLLDEPAEPFDIVLMDMQMPVMDGYQATRTLRERGYAGPVIAVTAHAMDGDRQKTLDAGCDDYATKPYHPPQLLSLIRRYTSTEQQIHTLSKWRATTATN